MVNIDPKQIADLEAWLRAKGETLAKHLDTMDIEITRWKHSEGVTDHDAYARAFYLYDEMRIEDSEIGPGDELHENLRRAGQ